MAITIPKGSLTQLELAKLFSTKTPQLPDGIDAVAGAQPVSPTTNRNNEARLVYASKYGVTNGTSSTGTKTDTGSKGGTGSTGGTTKSTGASSYSARSAPATTTAEDAYRAYLANMEKQRRANLDATIRANNMRADKSAQDAYVAYMKTVKNLPQQLRSAGVSGGGSETTLADIANTYQNNRNTIMSDRDNNNARATLAYQQGVDSDYGEYLTKVARLGTTSGTKASSSSAKTTSAKTNASDVTGTKATTTTYTPVSSKSDLTNNLNSIIQYYKSLGYSDAQITQRMQELGIVG